MSDPSIKTGAPTCPTAISATNDAQALLAAVRFNGTTHDKLSAAQATRANSLATTLDATTTTGSADTLIWAGAARLEAAELVSDS